MIDICLPIAYRLPVIRSYRSKALKLFATKGDASRLPVQSPVRVRLLLVALDAAAQPEDMNAAGFDFHGLQGRPKRYAIKVSANYRLTFGWDAPDAIDVDLEDYH